MTKVQRFWAEEAKNIRCVRETDYDAALAREAALQQRLNEADQRIDEAEQMLSRCVMSVREQHCDEDEAEFDLPATLIAQVDAFLSQLTKDSDYSCTHDYDLDGPAAGPYCKKCGAIHQGFKEWLVTKDSPEVGS